MDMISDLMPQENIQLHSLQDQVNLVSECLLMAGAIKRHNEDAAIIVGDVDARLLADDMHKIIDGADGLLEDLENNQQLNSMQAEEIIMVWNKLRHIVSLTYQGRYFFNQGYN